MPHTPLTYLFGFTALFMVFVLVANYAYTISSYTRIDLEKKQYRLVAETVAARIRSGALDALLDNASFSSEIVFPCETPDEMKYNIFIGYGASLPDQIREREEGVIDDTAIYVVVARPDYTVYDYVEIDNGSLIRLSDTLSAFSSTSIVEARYTPDGGAVVVELRIVGVRSR